MMLPSVLSVLLAAAPVVSKTMVGTLVAIGRLARVVVDNNYSLSTYVRSPLHTKNILSNPLIAL